MSKRHGWLSPDVVDGHETTCISLYIPDDMAHRAAFWGAITELARDHNWDTGGDEQKAADLATYWRHLIFEGLTEDCSMAGVVDVRLNGQALEKTFDGETWEQFATLQEITSAVAQTLNPGENATVSLIDGVLTIGVPRGADGADGTAGLPGEPGASVELQVYFGTLQWRNVGTEVWNHLINLSEITGADGAPGADADNIEIYIEDGVIWWRYVGATEGTPLIEIATLTGPAGECECEDETPAPANSAQNRCGVAVRVTGALKAAYQRVKLDSGSWTVLQDLAGEFETSGSAAALASQVAEVVIGTGVAAAGLGLLGGALIGAAGLLKIVDGLSNNSADEFTIGRQEDLQEGLYCVLTRQETTDISLDVLREWVHYIADAGFPAVDLEIIVGILAYIPLSYWRNEAAVAAPEINPCSGVVCVAPDEPFAYQFSGNTGPGGIPLDDALASALMTPVIGIKGPNGINAVPTLLDTRRFNLRVNFGRYIPITQIEATVAYIQTRAATSPITITGENFSATTSINGVSSGTKKLYSTAAASVKEFSISGEIATTGDFDSAAGLVLTGLKICGEGFPPFGIDAINDPGCTPPLCAELDPQGYTKMIDFCFRESDYGMIPQGMNQQNPHWVPGEGWKSGWRIASSVGYRETVITWPRAWGNVTLNNMIIRVEYSLTLGTTFGGTGQYLWLTGASGVVTHINQDRTTANNNQPVFQTTPANRNFGPGNMRLQLKAGQRFNADPGGEATIHRITFYHNSATDPYTILPEDL